MASIRIDEKTRALLQELAQAEHKSMGRVVEEAVQRYDEDRFWNQAELAYRRLQSDPAAWREYQQEIALFDTASMDGLDDYPYDDDEVESAGPTASG